MPYVLIYFSCCEKLKEVTRYSLLQKEIIWSKYGLKVQITWQKHLSDLNASANEISTFYNPFNCVIEELPPKHDLEEIDLQGDDMLKCRYQEKRLIKFCQCPPPDEYVQLRVCTHY